MTRTDHIALTKLNTKKCITKALCTKKLQIEHQELWTI